MTKITVEDIFLELYFGSLKKGKGFYFLVGFSSSEVEFKIQYLISDSDV